MKCSQGFYPVAAYQDVSAFKLYYSDMGIMSARLGMTLEALQGKETEHFRGILTENYVAIALKTNGYDLHYWESDNTAEVDFLIQKDSHVIPVECKAGNHVKAKSMMVYMEIYYRKLIIFLEVLKCRQSLMFQGFPAFLVTEDVLKSP